VFDMLTVQCGWLLNFKFVVLYIELYDELVTDSTSSSVAVRLFVTFSQTAQFMSYCISLYSSISSGKSVQLY